MRMKRKPLKYVEQRRLVRFHSHHKEMETMTSSPHFVCLPVMSNDQPSEPLPPITTESTTVQPVVPVGSVPPDIKPTITPSTTVTSAQPPGMQSSNAATSRTKILDTIRAMNNKRQQLNPNVPIRPPGPLPHPLRTGLTSINPGMIPSQQTPRSMPTSVVPHPNIGPMAMQPPRPVTQAAPPYRATWYDLILQDLTPENRNYISTLPIEQRKLHLINLRRDMERRRMLQQQQQMRMQGVGFPPHMSHPGGPMHVTPPVQMTQVMQQQQQQQQQHRLMAAARYPPPAQMPPPAHHPQPYMVPGHHPQAMFRQPGVMYGQGIPPRQQHMPYPH